MSKLVNSTEIIIYKSVAKKLIDKDISILKTGGMEGAFEW